MKKVLFTVTSDDGLLDVEFSEQIVSSLLMKIWHVIKVKYRMNKRIVRKNNDLKERMASNAGTDKSESAREQAADSGRADGTEQSVAGEVTGTGVNTPSDIGGPEHVTTSQVDSGGEESEDLGRNNGKPNSATDQNVQQKIKGWPRAPRR